MLRGNGMIGRWSSKVIEEEHEGPKGFDAFELRLGDVMRGERATMGKSLLDVQRELRIKAAYIAAIENADPDAFDTPGFIAGYVRSYARYLGMDPDKAFASFCEESGFQVAHGLVGGEVDLAAERFFDTGGVERRGYRVFDFGQTQRHAGALQSAVEAHQHLHARDVDHVHR